MDLNYSNEDQVAPDDETASVASPEETPVDHDGDDETTGEETTDERSQGPGRPRHQPSSADRERVYDGAKWGEPQAQIARRLKIDPKTLRKYYSEELELGAIEANNAVMQSLFTMATERQKVGAAIFWAKTRCALRPGGIPYDTAPGAPNPKPAKPSNSETDENGKPQRMRFTVYCNDGEPNAPY